VELAPVKVEDALQGISTVFLDTAPVVVRRSPPSTSNPIATTDRPSYCRMRSPEIIAEATAVSPPRDATLETAIQDPLRRVGL